MSFTGKSPSELNALSKQAILHGMDHSIYVIFENKIALRIDPERKQYGHALIHNRNRVAKFLGFPTRDFKELIDKKEESK